MADVIVIGAGPAGLAAARAVCDAGKRVMLLDASDDVGGQYWRHLPPSRPSRHESILHHDWSTFRDLRERLAHDDRCDVVTSAHVWAITDHDVYVVRGEADGSGRESRVYSASAVILATGAHDRVLPVPGWELPGVFTAGGAQALAKGERVAVGSRVVVAGAGPFLLPVAAALALSGCTVLGVYEASDRAQLLRSWAVRPWELLSTPKKVTEFAHYLTMHVRHRIPYVTNHAVTRIHGDERVESVTISAVDGDWRPIPGSEKRVMADAVCLGHGFTPRLELALSAGCHLTRQRFVDVDASQRTSVRHVFAAGEITGIGGADLALAEGAIAGHVAAGGRADDPAMSVYRDRRRALRQFAGRIEAGHAINAAWSSWLTDETIVCRCEGVTYATLRHAVETTQSTGLRSLKLLTRAGLGACQGRTCGRSVEALLGELAPGGHLRDSALSDRRPIAIPLRLGEIASTTPDLAAN